MTARIDRGWITTPYGGDDRARVEIAVGIRGPGPWLPAYLDYVDGERVARVRPRESGRTVQVWIRVDGVVTTVGGVTL